MIKSTLLRFERLERKREEMGWALVQVQALCWGVKAALPPPPLTLAHALGAKKPSFEQYTITGNDLQLSSMFPLPRSRNAVRLHKKHAQKGGVPIQKIPQDVLQHHLPLLNINEEKIKIIHLDPLVVIVDKFLSQAECDECKSVAAQYKPVGSATFNLATASARSSTTWYARYQDVALEFGRAQRLTGWSMDRFEEPQLVRYRPGESFGWHYDAVPATKLSNGGQRLATFLVYLNEPKSGGSTAFRDLRTGLSGLDGSPQRLQVEPKVGRALFFFPSDGDGTPDERTLHAGMPPIDDDKWILQSWIRQRVYVPSGPDGTSQTEAATMYNIKCGID